MMQSEGILLFTHLYLLHLEKTHLAIVNILSYIPTFFPEIMQNESTYSQKDLWYGNLFKLCKSHACPKFSNYSYADVFLLPPTLWIISKTFF